MICLKSTSHSSQQTLINIYLICSLLIMDAKICQRGLQKNPFSGKCDLPKVENWELKAGLSYKDHFEFHHEKTRTKLEIYKHPDGDWSVSILRKRSLYEYLAGGTSRIHDADRVKAMELAKAYMLLHPMGHKNY